MHRVAWALIAFGMMSTSSVGDAPATYEVRWVGALHKVMMGADEGVISLQTLEHEKHLYAIGPLEGLDGEITVFDGEPAIARVRDGRPVVERTFEVRAPLLIWAFVKSWASTPLPSSVGSLEELDAFVGTTAKARGLDTSAPFPFRVTARVREARMHIVNRQGRPAGGHAEHESIQFPLSIKDTAVELIGFWSDRHQRILTHMGSNIHVHGRTAEGSLSGHVDEVSFVSGEVWLPGR